MAQGGRAETEVGGGPHSLASRITVLVVDDDSAIRQMAKAFLGRKGHAVLSAASAAEAIAHVREARGAISVVILDMSMPKTGGAEALREMRKEAPDLKVVVSTGYGRAEAMRLFDGQAISGFLEKPYTPGRLIEAILAALRQE